MADVRFCGDRELGYARARTSFVPGAGLAFDDAYRLAHLPLVAPEHPKAIAARAGTFYDRGRHPRVVSLALPVPWPDLAASAAFQDLEAALRAAPFAPKLAWDILARRRDRLHATVCASLAVGDATAEITPDQRRALAGLGPIRVELRGLFSGNLNLGRLYLRVYPECRDGENTLRRVQRALGRRETDLYVVGLHNLVEELDPAEAAALASLLERWWDRPILRLDVTHLWLLWALDDLVLDGGVAEDVALVSP